jgi:iron uptake system component EfeO
MLRRGCVSRWFVMTVLVAACSSAPKTVEQQAIFDVKQYLTNNLNDLYIAAQQIQAAAPADAWDAASLDPMKSAWQRAHVDYDHLAGVVATLFPDIDTSIDQRYDAFLAAGSDDDLFDDQGMTGLHALERIMWSNQIPAGVITFESKLVGYQAAAFPATSAQAAEVKDKLCARLISDVAAMREQFAPLALDSAAAWSGVENALGTEVVAINDAANGKEVSRYAQFSLADLRAQLAAGQAMEPLFHAWLLSANGADAGTQLAAGFARLQAIYDAQPGDALPPLPGDWITSEPSDDDLASPFGVLWQALQNEADTTNAQSLLSVMKQAADLLGIAELP